MYDRPQINEASRLIVEQKRLVQAQQHSAPRMPVHERLYKQQRRQTSARLRSEERDNKNAKSARPPIPQGPNYGEKLY
jgi:hypothetical protein